MKAKYKDIRDRIPDEPLWYDCNGVPRYDPFTPGMCPVIYANQVVLMRIACAGCGRKFYVQMHGTWFHQIEAPRELQYGDPPAHNCVGDSMSCDDLEVIQVWARDESDWVRYPEQEGVIE